MKEATAPDIHSYEPMIFTYVNVTAKGSPSGTATTTIVTCMVQKLVNKESTKSYNSCRHYNLPQL